MCRSQKNIQTANNFLYIHFFAEKLVRTVVMSVDFFQLL